MIRSALGRPIDPSNPGNVLGVLVPGLIAIGAGAWELSNEGTGAAGSLLVAVWVFIAGFLAWALTRELDPPRQYVAVAAAVLGGVFGALWTPYLAVGFLIMLGARIAAATVSRKPTRGDVMVLTLAGALAATENAAAVGVAALIAGVLWMAAHSTRNRAAWLRAATGTVVVAAASITIGALAFDRDMFDLDLTLDATTLALLAGAAALTVVEGFRMRREHGPANPMYLDVERDAGGGLVRGRDVLSARLLTIATLATLSITVGMLVPSAVAAIIVVTAVGVIRPMPLATTVPMANSLT